MSVTFDLSGQCALVTGASRGNGLLCAQKLAKAGADVYLQALDSNAAMEAAAAKVRAAAPHRRIAWGIFDFADMDAPNRMVDAALAAHGRVDILINNAVMRCNKPFGEFTGEEFDRMVAINLRPAFLASQAVLPAMRKQGGGRIVHVASQIGLVAQKHAALYGMTKAGLIYLARAMSYELATENIFVNAISPGVIMSDSNVERLKLNPELEAERLVEIPMGRYGDPEEIAEAIMYLVAGAPPYLQGHNLVVDGGYVNH
ncbi:MAG TPA: SDR family oxidoreductase [Burkholderiales bacterium]|nr:SDR family oxidoreductase [Burkholderiales bacterium]